MGVYEQPVARVVMKDQVSYLVRYGESLSVWMVRLVHHDVALVSLNKENSGNHVFEGLLVNLRPQERRYSRKGSRSFCDAGAME